MNELISVTTDGRTTSKDLYSFLQLDPGNYTRWCKVNIIENQFSEEGIDWGLFLPQEEKLNYRPSQNYWLTISFAKKLCMVSQTERGEQARNYFIEIEKRFVSGMLLPDFTNPAAAARAWADQVEARMQAETKLLEAKPALEFVSRYVEAEQKKGVREVAKVMNIKETEFVDFLLKNRIMFRQQNKLLPYAEHQQAGYFEVKTGEKNGYAYHQTRFTTKGIAWIANKLSKARGV